ncbi:DUF5658 family protein [Aquibacillus rhizosphaerae]|uniref:DUF5658 family protein n=1 Tax=Aquibacillus rhizosphaerae TaxID=3051431 RepID=A0ABT7LB77_9BACI|nr:DUF5658 family protein [Aquibacillus sp. LR5S19]MDL4841810.1 DUF5658 family protein [Aquibacillus sp. LR5S19]
MLRLFVYLAILNLMDGIFTFYGLKYSYVSELNPLMGNLYQLSPKLFITVKILLSMFLVMLVIWARIPNTKLIKGLVLSASVLYTITFVLHGLWLFGI